MSKLPNTKKFIDLSDYGRPVAIGIAHALKETRVTPIHVTIMFIVSGLIAVWLIIEGEYVGAGLFLVLKSILDAADGELARVKKTPSYTGRYFDSVGDSLLNALFVFAIGYTTDAGALLCLLSFISIQLQGTLYNYYYVILRNRLDGDTTSRVFETHPPVAFPGERQKTVSFFFRLYTFLYGAFDRLIYALDPEAPHDGVIPRWFMTLVSLLGLGSQLLIMAILLVFGKINLVIPFFIGYSILIFVFVAIRRLL